MTLRRVAVTGVSAISALGVGRDRNWASLMESRSGIDRISAFDPAAFRSQIAGQVKDFKPETVIPAKDIRMMDLFIQYSLVACEEAFRQTGLTSGLSPIPESLQERAGCLIGCGLGGLPDIETTQKVVYSRGPSRISPFFIPKIIANLAPGHAGIYFGLRAANFCTTSACSSGAHAIGEAFRYIRHGYADLMVCGGTEATISPLCVGGFDAMRALSTRNDAPQKASRPFDVGRDGFVVGEGAGIIVLEEWESARKRGAHILAEMVGYGANCDAFHITAPSEGGQGAGRAMQIALEDAKISRDAVGALNAHGTSTQLGDIAETMAIKRVFGDHAKKLKVSATKSMTGHCLGAAGGIEAVFSVLSLVHQKVPPTLNLDQPDPECDLDYVPHHAQDHKCDVIISNSFGFGGTNASLVFKRV